MLYPKRTNRGVNNLYKGDWVCEKVCKTSRKTYKEFYVYNVPPVCVPPRSTDEDSTKDMSIFEYLDTCFPIRETNELIN